MWFKDYNSELIFYLKLSFIRMQVADRFHLHQNLLEAIKKALNHELPATVCIPHVEQSTAIEEPCKKSNLMWISRLIFWKRGIK